MKISELQLNNVKCFKNKKLTLTKEDTNEPLSVCALVGANGSGKSTILKSIVAAFTKLNPEYGGELLTNEAISFGENIATVSINRVIPKPYAIDKALDYFKTQKTEFSKLYISVDALKVKHIKDYMNKVIFNDIDGNLSGWLFCFDPTPFANWGHQCVYLFVISDRNYQEVKYDMGLNENILMEKIY